MSKMYSEILNLAAGPRLLFVTKFRLRRGRIGDNSVKTKQKEKKKKKPVLFLGLVLWGYVRDGVLSITPELAGKRLFPTIEFTSFLLLLFSLEPQGHHPSKEPFLKRRILLRLAVNLRKLIMVLHNKMILYCFSPSCLLSSLLRREADRCSATN